MFSVSGVLGVAADLREKKAPEVAGISTWGGSSLDLTLEEGKQ